MRKLEQPGFEIEEILEILKTDNANYLDISVTTNKSIEESYTEICEKLSYDETQYIDKSDELITFTTSTLSEGIDEKIFNKYDEYNRKATLQGYRYMIYELAGSRCPICDTIFGYSQINLDHILPKSEYKSLAITPINIVPTCNCCNMKKNKKKGKRIFSPYFHEYDLTKLLIAKIEIKDRNINDEGIISDVRAKIYVKQFGAIEIELGIYSQDELNDVEENIRLYGLFEKYSFVATTFVNETMKYFKKLNELHPNCFLFSKSQIRDLLETQDIWDDKCSIGEKIYCDETFIKHITIEAMKKNEFFLGELAKIVNGNIDVNQLIKERIQEATDLINKKSEQVHMLNCNALVKKNLSGSDVVAYYRVNQIEENKFECELLDFQGPYQDSKEVFKFEVTDRCNSFDLAIKEKKIQVLYNEPILRKFNFYEKNVGTLLLVPILDDNKNCIGIVCIFMEGDLDENVKLDVKICQELQNALNKIYTQSGMTVNVKPFAYR